MIASSLMVIPLHTPAIHHNRLIGILRGVWVEVNEKTALKVRPCHIPRRKVLAELKMLHGGGFHFFSDFVPRSTGRGRIEGPITRRGLTVSDLTLDQVTALAARLPAAERKQLAETLLRQLAEEANPAPRRRFWREIRGHAAYPLCGEDAQAWVSRTRQESDEQREAQWRSAD
jgi:hypothetical protein